MRRRAWVVIGVFVAIAALVSSAGASAAERFAEPTGDGAEPCLQTDPCELEMAIEAAADGDTVYLAPGEYNQTSTITVSSAATIRSQFGTKPSQTVVRSTAINALTLADPGATVMGFKLDHTGPASALRVQAGSFVWQMIARSQTGNGCVPSQITISDTVCQGGFAGVNFSDVGDATGSANLSGVTAIGGDYGIRARSASGFEAALAVRNTITQGGVADLSVTTDGSASTSMFVTPSYSNYSTTAVSGLGAGINSFYAATNQTAQPLLNLTTYRQLPGSPTINAGDPDNLTSVSDFEGEVRPQGARVDIGADEADGVAPQTTLGQMPDLARNAFSVQLSSDEPAAEFECSIDGSAWGDCVSPVALSPANLGEGLHTLRARAVDVFGNTDATPAQRSFRFDTTLPSVKWQTKPKKKGTKRVAKFRWKVSEAASVTCKLDRKKARPCQSKLRAKVRPGKHRLTIRAVDAAGNASQKSYSWRVKR